MRMLTGRPLVHSADMHTRRGRMHTHSGLSSPPYVGCESARKTPCQLAVLTGVRAVFFSAALASLPTAMRARLPMFCGTSLIALRTLSDGIAA